MTLGPGPGDAARGYGNVRASAADRERAIDVLKAAFAEGRLTREEHEARVERAYRSRTYADLAALTADLPAGPLGTLSSQAIAAPTAYLPAAESGRTNSLAIASLVCGLIPLLPQHSLRSSLASRHAARSGGPASAVPRSPPPVSRWARSGLFCR